MNYRDKQLDDYLEKGIRMDTIRDFDIPMSDAPKNKMPGFTEWEEMTELQRVQWLAENAVMYED